MGDGFQNYIERPCFPGRLTNVDAPHAFAARLVVTPLKAIGEGKPKGGKRSIAWLARPMKLDSPAWPFGKSLRRQCIHAVENAGAFDVVFRITH